MKSPLIAIFIALTTISCAQNNQNEKTEKFAVYGNCGMCKKTIEKAAKSIKGVYKAEWSADNQEMTLSYDSTKTNVQSVQTAIAETGYDTQEVKGNDKAYANLHECCQYDRKK